MEDILEENIKPQNDNDTASVCEASTEGAHDEEVTISIAKKETRDIRRLKLFVFVFLIVSCICVAFVVYRYTSRKEREAGEKAFADHAEKVNDAIGRALDLTLGAVDGFVVGLVSQARSTNQTWPFVTLPDFAVRLSKVLSLSKALVVTKYHVVATEQKEAWENFTIQHKGWIDQSLAIQKEDENFHGTLVTEYNTTDYIWGNYGPIETEGPYLPTWESAPVIPYYSPFNWDGFFYPALAAVRDEIFEKYEVAISAVTNLPDPDDEAAMYSAEVSTDWVKDFLRPGEDPWEPFAEMFYPILDTAPDGASQRKNSKDPTKNHTVVGVVGFSFFWRDVLRNILPYDSNGIVAVFENDANQSFTYQINGPETLFLGRGDLHDPNYEYMKLTIRLADSGFSPTYGGLPLTKGGCQYNITLYASQDMRKDFETKNPAIFTIASVCIFIFTTIVFLFYDWCVERRQSKVMKTATEKTAIVSSLFPSNVHDRLFPMEEDDEKKSSPQVRKQMPRVYTYRNPLDCVARESANFSPPIADLFPEATVAFADIAGFTAWSSIREPMQVFLFLETVYNSFDQIAKRKGVFKVETIGDSYVAVAGVPDPRKDHAVVMAKFARDIRANMKQVTRNLEVTLGPDTGDLQLRIGLHSGPVTGGVLRGEKSRFQLFGDTVNTASRMESHGAPDKIHVSQITADLLIYAGKGHWLTKREVDMEANRKGYMQTYWVEPRTVDTSNSNESSHQELEEFVIEESCHNHLERLVDWNFDVCERLINEIVARRAALKRMKNISDFDDVGSLPFPAPIDGATFLDEVKEVIDFPEPEELLYNEDDDTSFLLTDAQRAQLHKFISMTASLYNDNPFHNFEHATHMTMSLVKLLGRIAAPVVPVHDDVTESKISSELHDYTYGIASDPLTLFACVFAAIIHDVDHPGVPNTQLLEENDILVDLYGERSIAEQNSLGVAWELFMNEEFMDLRNAICGNISEMIRFRRIVVNCVIATDVMDLDRRKLRNDRWENAFKSESTKLIWDTETINRRATVVIEHLVQASDVAHTMQHWQVYLKWNRRLFEEMYNAYTTGITEKNPADFWYQGEIEFFDAFVIPLAEKLRECGVFSMSSDEFLSYAQKNRKEWEMKGQEIVGTMVEKMDSLIE